MNAAAADISLADGWLKGVRAQIERLPPDCPHVKAALEIRERQALQAFHAASNELMKVSH